MTSTIRKRAERQRRREAGERRVEVWLTPKAYADLQWLLENGYIDSRGAFEQALYWLRYSENDQ